MYDYKALYLIGFRLHTMEFLESGRELGDSERSRRSAIKLKVAVKIQVACVFLSRLKTRVISEQKQWDAYSSASCPY